MPSKIELDAVALEKLNSVPKDSKYYKKARALYMFEHNNSKLDKIEKEVGISKSTLYRWIKKSSAKKKNGGNKKIAFENITKEFRGSKPRLNDTNHLKLLHTCIEEHPHCQSLNQRHLLLKCFIKKIKTDIPENENFKISDRTFRRYLQKHSIGEYKKEDPTALKKHREETGLILSKSDIPIIREVLRAKPKSFKAAYFEISEKLDKKFDIRTLRNFMGNHNISY